MKTNIFSAKVQTYFVTRPDYNLGCVNIMTRLCQRRHRKYRAESSVLVRLGNFPAFSQSLDSAGLPAGEDYFVSEEQQTLGMEGGGGGGGSPVRMVSRAQSLRTQ